jgi:hypothetical protein
MAKLCPISNTSMYIKNKNLQMLEIMANGLKDATKHLFSATIT